MKFHAIATVCKRTGYADRTARRLIAEHLSETDGDYIRFGKIGKGAGTFVTEAGLEKLFDLLDKNDGDTKQEK